MKRRTQTRSASARQERREVAEKMIAAWRELTPVQQLASLDARLGKGVGAKRQRAKLDAIINPANTEYPNVITGDVASEALIPAAKSEKRLAREAKSRKGGKK